MWLLLVELAQLNCKGGGELYCAENDVCAIISRFLATFISGMVELPPPPAGELGQLNQIFKIF